ncbi:MAG: adenylyltransferase/cytidyltransferase family protein [Candidatus Cryptobacteroides sp.]
MSARKVFVSGCYDLLHSGHVEFFKQASRFGDVYVGIGSDATYIEYKHRKPMFPQEERLFMVKSIRYVKDAFINAGSGVLDFIPTLDIVRPDVFVVNAEGGSEDKRRICAERGIEYVELQRTPHEGLQARSSSSLKAALGENDSSASSAEGIPTRLDLAGTWIDQPYVSVHHPGWAITISLEPTFEVRDRCGLSTSTRKMIQKIWPVKLPKMDPEMLARLVFCFENNPEREDGHISGAQDSIGICVPGLVRHYYDNNFWPQEDREYGGRDDAAFSRRASGPGPDGAETSELQCGRGQGHYSSQGGCSR